MAKRPVRRTNRTVLIVVESETEEAFLHHLKRLYYRRGMRLSVSVKNAHGHGPQGVINKLKSAAQTAEFDHRIAVLDADVPPRPTELKWLLVAKIETIVSTPAIEATLLAILGKLVPDTTGACKNELQRWAPGDTTDARYYEKHFQLEALEQARGRVPALTALIAAVSIE